MTSTTPATKTVDRAPRKPKDHLPSKSEQLQAEAAPPAGHDLLRPVTDLRSGEIATAQADIIDLFAELGIDLTDTERDPDAEVDNSPATLRTFGKFGDLLEGFAVDGEKFADFDRGAGSLTRMADLAMWFMAELGKSESSAI